MKEKEGKLLNAPIIMMNMKDNIGMDNKLI